jgi:acyl-CoA thioester hydrolase
MIDYDAKRMHYFEELVHAEKGWVSATSENMALHIDMAAKKVVPWPADVMEMLARVKAAHARLPLPDGVGRKIQMPQKP